MKDDALTSDAATLVAELRSDAALDSVAMDRLRERLAVSLTLAPLPLQLASTPAAPATAALVDARKGLLASKFGGLALFVLGTALGAWGHALVGAKPEPTAPRHVPVSRTSASPAFAAPPALAPPAVQAAAAGAPTPSATLAPSSHARANPRSASSASGPANGGVAGVDVEGVDAEVRLLDEARQAIADKDGKHALAALRSHADRYLQGALVQERSALLVKALVLEGRFAEARQAAKRFAEIYPSSMLLDSVNAAVSRIP